MSSQSPLRVGLVLGAGGVLGAAWLVGALHAIAAETGWDPRRADRIVGTSAGSVVGALLACGVPPEQMATRAEEETEHWSGSALRLHGRPALGPGSWRLALGSLARPYRHSPAALLAGVLPDGPVSTEPIRATVRTVCADGWSPHAGLWIVAVDYASGRRVVFGQDDAPTCDLADAVAASCAIPGFYRSVRIAGRRYVDGGLHSTSNLDLLALPDLDLVVGLNPTSSLHASAPRTLGERAAFALRQTSGRRLGAEARTVRAAGPDVVLIQPTVHDLDVMGTNLMSRRRRHEVMQTATRTVAEHLRESAVGEQLAQLSAPDPVASGANAPAGDRS